METNNKKLTTFYFLRRSPSFCFISILAVYLTFQIGVYVGRTWPNFPCPERWNRKNEENLVKVTNADLKNPTNLLATNLPVASPLRKPTAAEREQTTNGDIVFEENFVPAKIAVRRVDLNDQEKIVNGNKNISELGIIPNGKPKVDILSQNKASTSKKKSLEKQLSNPQLIFAKHYHILTGNADIGIPNYIQIREADTPKHGDFNCGGTVVPDCCAHYVKDIEEAKKICYSYSNHCKGFVLSIMSSSGIEVRYLMYIKTDVSKMSNNFLTDFFVKSKFMKEIDWKVSKRKDPVH